MVGKFGNFDKIMCDSLLKYYKLHPTTRGIDFLEQIISIGNWKSKNATNSSLILKCFFVKLFKSTQY